MAGLAESINGVVLSIMHLNKRECPSIVSRVGGSVGFVAAARSVLLVAQDPESEEQGNGVIVHAKSNLAPPAPTIRYQIESVNYAHDEIEIKTSKIVWGSDAEHIHVGDVLRSETQGNDEPGQKAEAKDWLQAFLQQGPRPSKEVFKLGESEGGFSKSTLKRAKKELNVGAKRDGFGEGGQWTWALPEENAKGAQGGSKGDRARDGEPLCSEVAPLCERSGLFDQKETVMAQGADGEFEEVVTDEA